VNRYKAVIDDNILMKDEVSTAGSKILYNFVPPFNAAVIDKLIKAGVKDIARTKPNEFGISLTQPFGCIDSVASGEADVGIGCDMNGAVRKEASKKDVCFIKPTYGTVSRFGLVSTSPSMEQIGIACKDISLGFEALSLIAGFDERDGTLADAEKYSFSASEGDLKGVKIGVPECCADSAEVQDAIKRLKSLGADVSMVDFPMLEYAAGVAYAIAAAETSNSISRFDGIKFGYRTDEYSNLDDIYINSRTESFTFETKLLTLMGMLVLSKEKFDAYFDKSLKIRRLIKEAADRILEEYNAVMTPVEYAKADTGGEIQLFSDTYENLKYLSLPNLTAVPAVSLPGGVQFMAKKFDENMLFRIGKCFQSNME
jgi:aspartyl-tRNA(Asn)/glutamyl-tRNA(Gln) amidotransferase subunit A